MRYPTFGRRTGLRLSEYALGTGTFGTAWGAGADASESRKVFNRFAEAGGTLIDTADGYQFGESEKLLGEFLGADRVPVIGPRKVAQLEDYLGALDVSLSAERLSRLGEVR